jgi:hypothetical protein
MHIGYVGRDSKYTYIIPDSDREEYWLYKQTSTKSIPIEKFDSLEIAKACAEELEVNK